MKMNDGSSQSDGGRTWILPQISCFPISLPPFCLFIPVRLSGRLAASPPVLSLLSSVLSYRGLSLLCLCETVIDFTAGWMNSATSPGCTFLLCVVIRSSCATCFQSGLHIKTGFFSPLSRWFSDCYHFRVSMSVTFWDFCMTGLVSVSHK